MTSKIVVGNRKVSEYSKELTLSKFNEYNILSLIFSDGLIDFDIKSNMYVKVNNALIELNNIRIEADNSNENLTSDKSITCTNLNLTSAESTTVTSKKIELNAGKIAQITAPEQISFESPVVILGALFKRVSDEIEMMPDYVMTKGRFDKWWNTTMTQFFDLIITVVSKYNQHTHPASDTPPSPMDLITGSESTISAAKNSSTMLKSITTKSI